MKAQTQLLALATVLGSSVFAQLPSGTTFQFSAPRSGTARLALSDAGNHSFEIQSSTDLKVWTNVETWKIHNGSFARELPMDTVGQPTLFYRAFHDPAAPVAKDAADVSDALKLPSVPANYANPALPARFQVQPILGQDNTPADNPVTNAGATLGRVIFYDKRLSLNQTISCSSCHQAAHGFSDPRKFSVGFNGGHTSRNSMGLTNARWYQRAAFFWDERAETLEDQVLQPIQNATEMGMTLPAVVARLSAEPFYETLFTDAFGDSAVTSERIAFALAQFVRSIVSTNTKFDAGLAVNFTNFTAEENTGRQIFNGAGNCAACHGTDNFVPGPAINNNGLENPYVDKGVGEITGRARDEGLFKVPSLRNIELTAPYMHDGRFATLEEVVEFYNSGIVAHPNLSPPLCVGGPTGPPRRLNLTAAQKAALVAFLKTITETSLTSDEKFSDPFNYGD
ncbi:MAG TPA: cytochrome c peroxidase [Luteolibacter sp.]|nr:cytochrome c peroxidase [Luteolibacter sp.]